jgi:hypothetical protein
VADPLDQYDPVFQAAGQEWNVDWRALKAIAAQESRGNARAVSPAGAQGLMQIVPGTQQHLGMTDPFDPVQSIYGAAKYMNEALTAERDNPQAALLYYHGGPGWRQRYGPESAGYVPGVASRYQQYAKADTGTMTDATPAPVKPQGGNDVAQADDPFTKALQAPAESTATPAPAAANAPDPFTAALGSQDSGASSEQPTGKLEDVVASPDAATADVPQPQSQSMPTPSIEQARDKVRGFFQGADTATLNALAPGPDAGPNEKLGRRVLATGALAAIRAAGGLAEMPLDVLLGLQRGPANALTINPETGTMNLTPEAMSVATLGASPLRFSGATPFVREPPGTFTKPPPVSVDELTAAIQRADKQPPAGATATPPEGAAPQPESAGAAATPTTAVGMTPGEEQAYRSTAEGRKLLEQQQPGLQDRNAYVQGVQPNQAEIEQTVNAARELKSLGAQSTEVSQAQKEIAAANNEARQQHFERIAGSPVDVENAVTARQAQADADLKATWANKTDADASPVLDLADQIKASPDGRRPAVRKAVDSVTGELHDADGNLITDPEQLYGVRKHIDDLLSKEGQRETPLSARASANLQALKEQLDGVIEAAAPGFKQYLQNFADASKRIDEMRVLQGHEAKLYDSQGRMTYNNVQRMMRNIVDSRAASGINPYKSISDDTMQQLWNLRDDLRRVAGAQELARTPGSDTTQNMVDLFRTYSRLAGPAAMHGVANMIWPGWGSLAVSGAGRAIAPYRAARAAQRVTARGMQMLRPTNALQNPNAPP